MGQWDQAGEGAIGGAMTGAAIGSVVPGIGTAVGAIGGGLIGGAMGYFGSQGAGSYEDSLKALANKYGNRGFMGAETAQAGDSSFRQNQAGLIAQLEAMARGQGLSAASMQMRQAMDRAAAAQASMAAGAGGRGVNAGASIRNASNQTAALQQGIAGQTALARVQEQLGATGMLGGVLQGARGQDLQLSTFNTGQANEMANANLQAYIQQQQMNQNGQLQALLAAMQAAGPGLGSQIMAGGASVMPMLAQRGGGGGAPGGGGGYSGGAGSGDGGGGFSGGGGIG